MHKVTLYLLIVGGLLVSTACTEPSSGKPAPEAAQQILKLRGYEFDEKSFFAAAQARDVMAINAFFDAGINPNAQDGDGRTVLISAAARGDRQVVDALLAGSGDELDIKGALVAMQKQNAGEILTVNDNETQVRIWID